MMTTLSPVSASARLARTGVLLFMVALASGSTGCKCSDDVCGDGVLTAGESCDGPELGGVTCASLGLGGGVLACNAICGFDTFGCDATQMCGNDAVDAGEDCDGTNLNGADCMSVSTDFIGGTLTCGATCAFDTSGCILPDNCGNGTIDTGEDCEGANLGASDCFSLGHNGGTLACSPTCQYDESSCTDCGNNMVESGEACDGTDLAGADCTSIGMGFTGGTLACGASCAFDTAACTAPVNCGNLTIDAGEDCDGPNLGGATCMSEGFDGGTLACTAGCVFNTAGCATCGNGMVETGEDCEGSNLNGFTCGSLGFSGGSLSCDASCSFNTSACTSCGNGMIEGGEACDGGNLGGASCTSIGMGFTGGSLGCTPSCGYDTSGCSSGPFCGDGTANGTEDCDGGDLGGATCMSIGMGFDGGTLACNGSCGFDTSGCTSPTCPNGTIDPGEDCDGANLGGATCISLGYDTGSLACTAGCVHDTSSCYHENPAGPGLEIGDNTAIWDWVLVDNACTISAVSVDVNITHPDHGQLQVLLTSPTGTTVVLHNGSGFGADIIGNYPDTLTEDGPGSMADYFGQLSTGLWQLTVVDAASGDVGTLNSWNLNVVCQPAPQEFPGALPIVPEGATHGRALTIFDICTVWSVHVGMNLTHPINNDIVIDLASPSGTVVRLHNQTANTLIGTYGINMFADGPGNLGDFVGEPATGGWGLYVTDVVPNSFTGNLNFWSVIATCLDSFPASPGVPVPLWDDTPIGIVDTIRVSGSSCTIADVTVDVNLTHETPGDVTMDLTSPSGTAVRLHNHTGGSVDDIIGNYPNGLTVDGPGMLSDFAGEPLDGTWRLSIADTVATGFGGLNDWALNASCQ